MLHSLQPTFNFSFIEIHRGVDILNFKQCLALAIACYTLQDVKNEACRALCVRDGYSSGKASKTGCHCVDEKPNYQDYMLHRAKVPIGQGSLKVVIPEKQDEF